ncbi:MAG: hypothetical protein LBV23_01380 [Deltaproteobacteria bacterium]|jgi:hypothetical protein|nr:hypothetical protein [Deltaproteobacteria bacterium]
MLGHPVTPILFGLAQLIIFLFLFSKIRKKNLKYTLIFIYLSLNICSFKFFFDLLLFPSSDPLDLELWNYLYRPLIRWQTVHLVALIPLALLTVAAKIIKLITNRRSVAFDKLFKAKKTWASWMDLRLLILFLLLIFTYYDFARSLTPPAVAQEKLSIPSLPSSLEGLKVAVISDYHHNLGLNFAELEITLAQLQEAKIDLLVIAGRLIDGRGPLARDYSLALSLLVSPPKNIAAFPAANEIKSSELAESGRFFDFLGLKLITARVVKLPDLALVLAGEEKAENGAIILNDMQEPINLDFYGSERTPNLLIMVWQNLSYGLKVDLFSTKAFRRELFPSTSLRENLVAFLNQYDQLDSLGRIDKINLIFNYSPTNERFQSPWSWPKLTILTLGGL